MTELDRIGNSDNFNFRVGSIVSARSASKQRDKRVNVYTVMVLLVLPVALYKGFGF